MKPKNPTLPLAQLLISFVIPLIILIRFSSDSQLGATKAFLLALLFPLAFELYNILKHKKASLFSLFAIAGIVATGAVTFFELSEGWLAVRRAGPFFLASLAILVSIWIKRPLVDACMPYVFDMKQINQATKEKNNGDSLQKKLRAIGYILAAFMLVMALVSLIVTMVVIKSPAGTSSFNSEYAHLRLLSLPFISGPLLLGSAALILYLVYQIEKLTGLDAERLLKTRKKSPRNK